MRGKKAVVILDMTDSENVLAVCPTLIHNPAFEGGCPSLPDVLSTAGQFGDETPWQNGIHVIIIFPVSYMCS